jgi:ribosomal protein S18 acetylase RimI-like enzyme
VTPDIDVLARHHYRAAAALMVEPGTPWARYGMNLDDALGVLESAASGSCLLQATDQGRLTGWIWYEPTGTFFHSGYVRILAVRQDRLGTGVGSSLLEAAEMDLFTQTANVFLLVSEWNTRARKFYQRHGYAEVGSLHSYVHPGVAELICWKTSGPIQLAATNQHQQAEGSPGPVG